MKSIVLRYGLFAALIIVGIPVIGYLIGGPVDMENAQLEEVIGYGSIILSLLIFSFLGMRKYRDQLNGGQLSFRQGLTIGLLIAVIPSLAFALYNFVYVEWLDPAFMETYFSHQLQLMEQSMSPEDFASKKAEMLSQKEMFMNPLISFVVMFFTVFLIGVVISVLLALGLKRKQAEALTTT